MKVLNEFIIKLDTDDLYYSAEYSLLDFTETVCKIHGQYKGIYLVYYKVFEWLADKLLWRNKTERVKMT